MKPGDKYLQTLNNKSSSKLAGEPRSQEARVMETFNLKMYYKILESYFYRLRDISEILAFGNTY